MNFLHMVAQLVDECKNEYEKIISQMDFSFGEGQCYADKSFVLDESYSALENTAKGAEDEKGHLCNLLGQGDNLKFMEWLLKDKNMEGKIDLIYVDPPFYSKSDYNSRVNIKSSKLEEEIKLKQIAYTDNWEGGLKDYLRMICLRLYFMKDLLSDTGCIWVHLDWHVVHYVKLIMDEIFGSENFINEIIWNYKSGGTSSRHFARKHDTLLFYGKTRDYYFEAQKEKSYNREYKPYHFKGVEEFEDHLGWYTMVNMKDVWQLDMVGRTSSERTGYATQKPEALIERIVKSCTKEGAVCADFFGGSGTLASVAGKMKRGWITCDMAEGSIAAIKKRMICQNQKFEIYIEKDTERKDTGLKLDLEFKSTEQYKGEFIISLRGYKPSEEIFRKLKAEDRVSMEEAQKIDPLCLIDSWSVDFDYDGKVHRPTKTFFREKGFLQSCAEIEKGTEENKTVSVRSIDVWGKEAKEIVII